MTIFVQDPRKGDYICSRLKERLLHFSRSKERRIEWLKNHEHMNIVVQEPHKDTFHKKYISFTTCVSGCKTTSKTNARVIV